MRLNTYTLLAAAALATTACAPQEAPMAEANGPARFQAHDIADFNGYAVSVADFNNDGRLDAIANSLGVPEVAWYENPTWERHVIFTGARSIVNQAMGDIDGDGIPEVAIQSSFAMQAENSEGINWVLRSDGQPAGAWQGEPIDRWETSHHVQWADADGDGNLELYNAPLLGPESLAPAYDQDQASFFWYDTETWTRHVIDDDIPGIIHRIRPVKWDDSGRDAFLMASFEGVNLYRASGSGMGMTWSKEVLTPGHDSEPAPRLGASDVGMGASGSGRILGTVEPWHGNEVVVYTEAAGGWQRRVLYDNINGGHEVVVVDLNADGYADIIANNQQRVTERTPDATPGVDVFYSPVDPATGEWTHVRLESEYAMNGCIDADMNNDSRPDLVCTGSGGKVRWYENLGL
ncbi:MAG: VCBS repeat-containing protein [Gemmatimonadota bacterium]|nr:VCBS repeat-containing protein [Gemmatimonadota bacterium]